MLWWYAKFQKIRVWGGLRRVKTKILFAQTMLDKIFGTKWRNPVELDRTRTVWYLLLRVFLMLLPKFNFWKGDWGLHLNLRFSNISLFPKILSLKLFGNSWGNSYTKFARCHVSFYLWLIGSALKNCKIPKYYDQDCSCSGNLKISRKTFVSQDLYMRHVENPKENYKV